MNAKKSSIWEPRAPLTDWFFRHQPFAFIVGLIIPGAPHVVMGHYLLGLILFAAACMTYYMFWMGWIVAIAAAVHAYVLADEGDPGKVIGDDKS